MVLALALGLMVLALALGLMVLALALGLVILALAMGLALVRLTVALLGIGSSRETKGSQRTGEQALEGIASARPTRETGD